MSKQFNYTTSERRSSVVYSTSVGKGGLYTPADYIPEREEETVFRELQEEEEDVQGERDLEANPSFNTSTLDELSQLRNNAPNDNNKKNNYGSVKPSATIKKIYIIKVFLMNNVIC
ncbi:uncharacterized protein PWA37_000406 [Arxiozyma heterogenica]|uniref:uncharacterized protein n=1 Tax=Arxiozyma heterogenica TaxID=278026 RepID=UPI002F007547